MRFLCIGLGHCGGKIANDFKKAALEQKGVIIDVCVVNTDRADLATHKYIPEEYKLLIGTGKGAAKNWKEGYQAAVEAKTNIRALFERMLKPDTDVVILTLGEGGGTGSGVAPVAVEIISELGRESIAIVTLPFETESVKAKVNAAIGLDSLYRQEGTKALICIENDRITAHFPDKLLTDAYEKVNETAVQTFLNLINLAHMPSRADRIDESELASIFDYSGFATLANYRAAANLVEDLSATLRHSWNSSLFAEIDPTTATGVIFGVEGPTHLFTTTQVDSMRRTFREILAGKDAMLGIYPVERCRWASYVGILTGMDVPGKVKKLLETAKEESKRHEEILQARVKLKREGLGIGRKAPAEPTAQPASEAADEEFERAAQWLATHRFDVGPYLGEILEAIQGQRGRTFNSSELLQFIKTQVDVEDQMAIVAAILELQNRGYIIEVRKNIFRIASTMA